MKYSRKKQYNFYTNITRKEKAFFNLFFKFNISLKQKADRHLSKEQEGELQADISCELRDKMFLKQTAIPHDTDGSYSR